MTELLGTGWAESPRELRLPRLRAVLAAAAAGMRVRDDAPKWPEVRWSPPSRAVPPVRPRLLLLRRPAPRSSRTGRSRSPRRSTSRSRTSPRRARAGPDPGGRRRRRQPPLRLLSRRRGRLLRRAAKTERARRNRSRRSPRRTRRPSSLNWLLLDLGGRGADVEEAGGVFCAAELPHNAAMNDLMLGVAQSYYRIRAPGPSSSRRREPQAGQRTKRRRRRHRAGVATIADVLQARGLSQQKLAYDQVRGQIQTSAAARDGARVPVNLPVEAADLRRRPRGRLVATVTGSSPRPRGTGPISPRPRPRAGQLAHVRPPRGRPAVPVGVGLRRALLRLPRRAAPYRKLLPRSSCVSRSSPASRRLGHEERGGAGAAADAGAELRAAGDLPGLEQLFGSRRRPAGARIQGPPRERKRVRRGRARPLPEGVGTILDLLTAESLLANASPRT